jgi:hypothetical protein
MRMVLQRVLLREQEIYREKESQYEKQSLTAVLASPG